MGGKCYPEEFKIEAVKQIVDRGHSVSSVATHLDITTHLDKEVWAGLFHQ
jgi:transposase